VTSDAEGPFPGPPPRGARCPHCGTADTEVISLFGTQAITLQRRCRRCGTLYEALKYEEEGEEVPSSG